jgi:hypothetical protein
MNAIRMVAMSEKLNTLCLPDYNVWIEATEIKREHEGRMAWRYDEGDTTGVTITTVPFHFNRRASSSGGIWYLLIVAPPPPR